MTFIFRNRTIFWDISKWNRGQKKWNEGSNNKNINPLSWPLGVLNQFRETRIILWKVTHLYECDNYEKIYTFLK